MFPLDFADARQSSSQHSFDEGKHRARAHNNFTGFTLLFCRCSISSFFNVLPLFIPNISDSLSTSFHTRSSIRFSRVLMILVPTIHRTLLNFPEVLQKFYSFRAVSRAGADPVRRLDLGLLRGVAEAVEDGRFGPAPGLRRGRWRAAAGCAVRSA